MRLYPASRDTFITKMANISHSRDLIAKYMVFSPRGEMKKMDTKIFRAIRAKTQCLRFFLYIFWKKRLKNTVSTRIMSEK